MTCTELSHLMMIIAWAISIVSCATFLVWNSKREKQNKPFLTAPEEILALIVIIFVIFGIDYIATQYLLQFAGSRC